MERISQPRINVWTAGWQLSALVPQSTTSRSWQLGLALCCFVTLTIPPMVFVETVAGHPGLAPEIDEITHEIEKNPTSVALLLKRGQVYRTNKDLLNSLQDLDQATQLEPGNAEVLFQRSLTLAALGRDVEAEVGFDQFLEKEALLGKGQGITADASARDRAVAMAERAHIRARTGRTNLALTDYTAAIRILPVAGLYQARGRLQESQGKLAEAAAGYREGLSRLPHAIDLKKSLIKVEIARQQYSQALQLIDEELSRAHRKTTWLLRRGEVLAAMGQPDAAQMAREQALAEVNQTMTKRVTAIHRLYRAKVYLALGRVEEAKDDLRLAIQMAPNFAGAKDLLRKLEGS
jgi:tetratricopeptide (TPR) repeat protein